MKIYSKNNPQSFEKWSWIWNLFRYNINTWWFERAEMRGKDVCIFLSFTALSHHFHCLQYTLPIQTPRIYFNIFWYIWNFYSSFYILTLPDCSKALHKISNIKWGVFLPWKFPTICCNAAAVIFNLIINNISVRWLISVAYIYLVDSFTSILWLAGNTSNNADHIGDNVMWSK